MPNIENKHTFSLLIADDDSNLRAALKRVLRRLDCDIIEASSGEDAQRKMTSDIAVAVLDVEMPGGSGLEALT
ncbi:MAG: response regulator, partial [Bdellovibrionales bacterium]|nr:response regulator [Bdellovibrionales bacterium]